MTIESIGATLLILFYHWVADFLCQTTYMGANKGKSLAVLTLHVLVYTIVITALMSITGFFSIPIQAISFFYIIFVFHFATDFATSRLTGPQFAKKVYNGPTGAFTIIGFDQIMHYGQIFTIYYYLITRQWV